MFDECSSGFRQSFGGLHKIYGVNPDVAWFGKALGNGYGITAIIGKKKLWIVLKIVLSVVLSGQRDQGLWQQITLEIMEKIESWKIITKTGEEIQKKWKTLANEITKSKFQEFVLSSFSIISNDWLKYKTFITQEMLKKNFGYKCDICLRKTW